MRIKLTSFRDFLSEQLQDPRFRAEYEALELEDTIVRALIEAKIDKGLTQKQISERSGIAQDDINEIETGNADPSLDTLKRLAAESG